MTADLEQALHGETLPQLMERLWNSIANFADVETPGARTTVAWKGDFTTIVQDPRRFPQHQATLDNVLAHRQAALRTVACAVAAASALALASTNPLAAPAAIRACQKLAVELRAS